MMLANLTYLLLLVSLLIVPGFCCLLLLQNQQRNIQKSLLPLIAISGSYAIFIFSLLVFRLFTRNSELFSIWVFVYLSISIFAVLWLLKRKTISNLSANKILCLVCSSPFFWLAIATLLYQVLVGPYSEIPADVYQHLSLYQVTLRLQERGMLGRSLELFEIFQQK